MFFRIFTVLAVVALAISTWILSSPAHRPALHVTTGIADLPGYYLKDTVLTDYDASGAPSLRLEAERIDQIGHSYEVTLSKVRVKTYASGGDSWVLVADTAHIQPGGSVIDVSGNVQLHDGAETAINERILTDRLSYDVSSSVVSTQADVRIEYGARALTARGLVANLKARTIHLESKVNGRFQP